MREKSFVTTVSLAHGNTDRTVVVDGFDIRDCPLAHSIPGCMFPPFCLTFGSLCGCSHFCLNEFNCSLHNRFRKSIEHGPSEASAAVIPASLKQTSGARWFVFAWLPHDLFIPDFRAQLANMPAALLYSLGSTFPHLQCSFFLLLYHHTILSSHLHSVDSWLPCSCDLSVRLYLQQPP